MALVNYDSSSSSDEDTPVNIVPVTTATLKRYCKLFKINQDSYILNQADRLYLQLSHC